MISRLSEVSTTRDLTGINRPINAQTGTTYTLVFDDRGKILEFNNSSAITVTVPADSTTAFYDGDVMEVVQTGTGTVTFSAAGGVTINGFNGSLSLNGQWASATLVKRSANTWELLSKNVVASRSVGSSAYDGITLNAQTGTTYTLALSDAHKLVTLNNASGITLTVPTNGSVAFAIGDQVNIMQLGAGQVTVSSSATIRSQGSKTKLNGQYSLATLVKIASDEWVLVGNVTTATV